MAITLLGLPPEVRVLIYDYALYHEETDGIISPLPDQWEERSLPMSLATRDEWSYTSYGQDRSLVTVHPKPINKLRVLIAGQRYRLKGFGVVDGPHFYDLDSPVTSTAGGSPESSAQRLAWKGRREDLRENFEESAAARNGHDCCFACLAQPPLTRVCPLIRDEALASFYSVNHFHLEFSHWSTAQKDALPSRGPLDWWRAIGDTNLRCIKRMSMVFDVTDPAADNAAYGISVDVSPRGTHPECLVTVQVSNLGQFPDGSICALEQSRKEAAENAVADKLAILAPYTGHLQLHGLHVQGLECMISDLEPQGTKYGLRDLSALTPWSNPQGITAKYDAITAAIPEMKARLWKRARIFEVGRVVEDILCVLLVSSDYVWNWHEAKYFPDETKRQLERVRSDLRLAWTLLHEGAARDHGLLEEQHAELLRIRCSPTETQYEPLVNLLEAVEDEARG